MRYITDCLINRVINHLQSKPEKILKEIKKQFEHKIQRKKINKYLKIEKNTILNSIKELLHEKSEIDITKYEIFLEPKDLAFDSILFEFYIQELDNCLQPQFVERIDLLKNIVGNCGWLFCFGNLCIICDRPTKIFLDDQKCLHNIGSPAIEFSDGYHIYAYHGEVVPQQYGKLDVSQWQIEWVAAESNDRLKQLLVKFIGLERIFRECDVERIDINEQYELFNVQITSNSCNSSFNLLKDRDSNEKISDLTAVDSDKNTITTALNSRL
jgi:hypothetical protein